MKRIAPAVQAYLDSVPEPRRAVVRHLRDLVASTLPLATEMMLYDMPCYVLGEPIVSFKAQKNYFSLYFCVAGVVSEYEQELGKLNCGKGCVRFQKLEDLPEKTIVKMLKESAKRGGFRDLPAKNAGGAMAG